MNHCTIAQPAVATTLLPMRGSRSDSPSGVAIKRPASPMGETGRVAATLQKMGIGGCGLAARSGGEGEVFIGFDYSTGVRRLQSGDGGRDPRGRMHTARPTSYRVIPSSVPAKSAGLRPVYSAGLRPGHSAGLRPVNSAGLRPGHSAGLRPGMTHLRDRATGPSRTSPPAQHLTGRIPHHGPRPEEGEMRHTS